ncbi:hypothetical protein EES43_19235 [Streptomyces sp. ADI96-02]|nr:hypothetical protein EES43_19235 [Streptomyces sp. ADI96-02]
MVHPRLADRDHLADLLGRGGVRSPSDDGVRADLQIGWHRGEFLRPLRHGHLVHGATGRREPLGIKAERRSPSVVHRVTRHGQTILLVKTWCRVSGFLERKIEIIRVRRVRLDRDVLRRILHVDLSLVAQGGLGLLGGECGFSLHIHKVLELGDPLPHALETALAREENGISLALPGLAGELVAGQCRKTGMLLTAGPPLALVSGHISTEIDVLITVVDYLKFQALLRIGQSRGLASTGSRRQTYREDSGDSDEGKELVGDHGRSPSGREIYEVACCASTCHRRATCFRPQSRASAPRKPPGNPPKACPGPVEAPPATGQEKPVPRPGPATVRTCHRSPHLRAPRAVP